MKKFGLAVFGLVLAGWLGTIAALFAVLAAGPGSTSKTSDGQKWVYATGLTGSAGAVVNGSSAVILDGSGNGVKIPPPAGMVFKVKPRWSSSRTVSAPQA